MAGTSTHQPAESLNHNHSLLITVLERTNFIITALIAFSILCTRSAAFAYVAFGALACAISAKCVKRLIRQPRPIHSGAGLPKKTYGMPSTHSAVITHFAVYTCLASAYLPLNPTVLKVLLPLLPEAYGDDRDQTPQLLKLLPALLIVPLASLTVNSRVFLGHHTWPQCIAGCLFGSLFSLAWFTLWVKGLNHYGSMLEDVINRSVFSP